MSNTDMEEVEIAGEVKGESSTGLAWIFHDGTIRVFLPKSKVDWDEKKKIMTMPEWLAVDRGLV